jgi:GT2 family glycosyltransferase
MTAVSVVIVTFNSARDIGPCLASIAAATRVDHEVIVVDNASADGTPDVVRREYPSVRVIERTVNGGLSRAVNEGVRASNGRQVVALNPDTTLAGDAFGVLSAYLHEQPDVGVVAPRLLDPDGGVQLSCRRFPGYATAVFSRYSPVTRLFPRNRFSQRYLMSDYDHAGLRDVDWVSGAALMFPRSVFDEVGGWDDGFFMFSEDVDFCRRVHDAGYRVVYHPGASVYHRIGVSRRAPVRIVVARHRSMWRYYRKHLRGHPLRDAVTGAGIALRCASALAGLAAGRAVERVRGISPSNGAPASPAQ